MLLHLDTFVESDDNGRLDALALSDEDRKIWMLFLDGRVCLQDEALEGRCCLGEQKSDFLDGWVDGDHCCAVMCCDALCLLTSTLPTSFFCAQTCQQERLQNHWRGEKGGERRCRKRERRTYRVDRRKHESGPFSGEDGLVPVSLSLSLTGRRSSGQRRRKRQRSQEMSVQKLNAVELQQGTPASASWHRDYADTNTIYVGNLPPEMNEHDLLILFSQYGVPTAVHLARDPQTGRSKRFAFLTYEAWESTVLAVDNFDSWNVTPEHRLRVNHAYYKGRSHADPDRPDEVSRWEQAVKEELLDKDFA